MPSATLPTPQAVSVSTKGVNQTPTPQSSRPVPPASHPTSRGPRPWPPPSAISTRTILVLGASYAGHRVVQYLVSHLPPSSPWRVVVLERNTHANHVYAFPRCAVVPQHEQKVFIPYRNIFRPATRDVQPGTVEPHRLIHGSLVSLAPASAQLRQPGRGVATYQPLSPGSEAEELGDMASAASSSSDGLRTINFDYLVYALGSHLPSCINRWSVSPQAPPTADGAKADVEQLVARLSTASTRDEAPDACRSNGNGTAQRNRPSDVTPTTTTISPGSKAEGVAWLRSAQDRIAKADSVLVIGGGALGVQFAADIAERYGTPSRPAPTSSSAGAPPPKEVTLLCGSARLLPRFDVWLGDEARRILEDKLGVRVLLGARADLASLARDGGGGADEVLGAAGAGDRQKKRVVHTLDGRRAEADLVLFCNGQRPNTTFLRGLVTDASQRESVLEAASGMAVVNRHLQLALPSSPPTAPARVVPSEPAAAGAKHAGGSVAGPTTTNAGEARWDDRVSPPSLAHVFVVGDAADAFGALKAGHTAWAQAEVASRNLLRLVAAEEIERRPSELANGTIETERGGMASDEGGLEAWRALLGDDVDAARGQVEVGPDRNKHGATNGGSNVDAAAAARREVLLERYDAPKPAIKVSVGLRDAIYTNSSGTGHASIAEDLNSVNMWTRRGIEVRREQDLWQ